MRKKLTDRQLEYKTFLLSDIWIGIRCDILLVEDYTCEICHKRYPQDQLSVHHKNYNKPWGEEEPCDLQLLCRNCHARIHGIIGKRKVTKTKKNTGKRKITKTKKNKLKNTKIVAPTKKEILVYRAFKTCGYVGAYYEMKGINLRNVTKAKAKQATEKIIKKVKLYQKEIT